MESFRVTRLAELFKDMTKCKFKLEFHAPDETGAFLIDRDPQHFRAILNYLRNGEWLTDRNETAIKELLREADFYGLQALIEEINKTTSSRKLRGFEKSAEGNPDHTDKTKARPKSQKGGELHSLALAVETCNTLVNHNLIGLVARLHDPESMTNEVETDVAGLLQALRSGISCAHAIFDEKKAHFGGRNTHMVKRSPGET
ncbi:BTB/POZ domain-containing protein [Ditylenchus destructor]|uniref:BTB/POZ domain-containing protein n=1 Tax=Ditylenchus destructor TaxID=166010 RepID=A0AAD4MEE7_9BILA|nr:BTB/POZ domain-containing protein [Ditylenchus destructor]